MIRQPGSAQASCLVSRILTAGVRTATLNSTRSIDRSVVGGRMFRLGIDIGGTFYSLADMHPVGGLA